MVENLPENNDESLLTCIHPSYTVSGTPDGNEVEKLMIKNFLNTLAEVAIAVASREVIDK